MSNSINKPNINDPLLPLITRYKATRNKYESIDTHSNYKHVHEITDSTILVDLLIEGYIRTQCYFVPNPVKEIIVSYYNKRSLLRDYMKSKKEQKAAKLQIEKCKNYWKPTFNKKLHVFLFLVQLFTSIVAIIIGCVAIHDESTICNTIDIIINPINYTITGGALCLLHVSFIILHRIMALFFIDRIENLNEIKQKHKWFHLIDMISQWIMIIVYFAWSIIGFYIFQNATDNCKESNIAKMMISWSIIIFALTVYAYIFRLLPKNINDRDNYTIVLKETLYLKEKLFCLFAPLITISVFLFIVSYSHNNGKYSMLEAIYFIGIGGGVVMFHFVFIAIITLFMISTHYTDIVMWTFCTFYFVWSIQGFYIYHNKLSRDGTSFIIWSILAFVISFIYHCYFWATCHPSGTSNIGSDPRRRILPRVICTYPLLFFSIFVMIVAIYGDESICNSNYNPNWRNDLGIIGFLLTAGAVNIVYFIISLCELYITLIDYIPWHKRMSLILSSSYRSENIKFVYMGILALMGTFYLIWCIMGFVMYGKGMSGECKQDIVGQMVIAWSVIFCILGPCYMIDMSVLLINI